MYELDITHRKRTYYYYLPENWDELTDAQFIRLVARLGELREAFYEAQQAQENFELAPLLYKDRVLQDMRISVLLDLLNLQPRRTDMILPFRRPVRRRRAFIRSLFPDEVERLLQYTNWILTDFNRTKPLFHPYLKHNGRRYYGPGVNFERITGAEFHFADRLNHRWFESGEPVHMTSLMAIFYRPAGEGPAHDPDSNAFEGDIRKPFHPGALKHDAQRLDDLPWKYKAAFQFWWTCYVHQLQEARPDIFKQKKQKDDQVNDDTGWLDLFRQLAPHPIQIDEVARRPLADILYELAATKQEAERQRREMQSKK